MSKIYWRSASLSRKHIVREKDQGVEKLIWEIDWLNLLPDNLKPFFPKVIDFFKEENYFWFEMPITVKII